MAEDLLALADRIWQGKADPVALNPMGQMGTLMEMAAGVAFLPSFGNVCAFETAEGLVLVDTGNLVFAPQVHAEIRRWSSLPLHTVIYSHGHIDHVFGLGPFENEAEEKGLPRPTVVAHAGVHRRFERYLLTAGYNEVINRRQFQATRLRWPAEYRYPDVSYHRSHDLEVGGVTFRLNHAKGETDDHTWTWVPSKKVLCCGDFFIWATPNAGNPQKVQRYPKDWALALREMASLGAEIMLPGHGLPVIGAGRIVEALTDSADLLDSLHDQTVALMNEGATLDEVIHKVKAPEHLLAKPYLRPTYDEPEFIVRNVWRLYGGWFDGDPANLKPARRSDLAAEIASLAGGAARLSERAAALAASGEFRVACHLAEMAALAAPGDAEVHSVRAEVYEKRAVAETSLMAKGIYRWAASESRG